MHKGLAIFVCGALTLLAAASLPPLAEAQPPPDFALDDAAPGASFDVPTSIAFFPDGRILVAEKAGRAWVVQNGIKYTTPLWDATNEVLDNGDRGLTGIAVDPDYAVNHYIYLAYTVDPDSDGVDDNDVAFGRVTRYRTSAADSNVVDPASRTILLGAAWATGIPDGSDSHTIDALRWGTDGSLLISAGEGGLYTQTDAGGLTPNLFLPGRSDPYEDIGSFRAQSVSSLGGKVLRINPATGQGYPSNPFYDGNPNSNRSKIWTYGLRNPWRFVARPGSGSADPAAGNPGVLYVGNVGLDNWEALEVARHGGVNFGWPCYEGAAEYYDGFNSTPAHDGCGSFGSPDNPAQPSVPTITYHHTDSTLGSPPGFIGNCIIGGQFYNGIFYPPQYVGSYFFADFGRAWIKVAVMDSSDHLVSLTDFAQGVNGPVDFAADPTTGDLYFVSIYENAVRHIRYTGTFGGDNPPYVNASSAPKLGIAPLAVNFYSTGTLDPDGDPMTFNWNFGDGQGSTSATTSHTYTTPGLYSSVLTVSDGRGGIGRDTTVDVAAESFAFPTTGVLDDFNRADGPIGPSWIGGTSGFAIAANALGALGGGSWGLWSGAQFGPSQEAYFTFTTTPTPHAQHNLYLKVQGTSIFNGCVRVSYDTSGTTVTVSTFTPTVGWQTRGGPYSVSFASGNQFGARIYANGVMQVLKNGSVIATPVITAWSSYAQGGYIGLEMINATSSKLDNFGGGDAVINGNLPPVATILSPANGIFYAAGDSIHLISTATDDRDPIRALQFRWDVDLNHNNHIHPDVFVATTQSAAFVAQNHDDGTGVSYSIHVKVTDTGGATGQSSVQIWPNIDLRPTSLVNFPDTITTIAPATYRFTIFNAGRMPAPISHWRLTTSNGLTLAQGDTIVAAGATVTVSRVVPPLLAPGRYTLRVKLDTLNVVHETIESNNARVKTLVVKAGTVDVDPPPLAFALSGARPNPSLGAVAFTLELPLTAKVGVGVFDLQGREVWRLAPRDYLAGRWNIAWPGRLVEGASARPGLYLARIEVNGHAYMRRFVLLK